MAISIDWPTKIINVPRADMTLIQSSPTEIRELDINAFRLTLRSLEDDADGIGFPKTHRHNTEVTLGGLTFARVVEIINGYTITFEDGQYAVELVNANSNIADKTNVNQVSVRSHNSAGLISNPAIEYASFNNGVTIDIINGVAGTTYNIGTPENPVNNINDALSIANIRGFTTFYIIGDITLGTGTNFQEKIFVGESKTKSTITIDTAANVSNCEFYDAEILGTLDGGNILKNCLITNLNYADGQIENCALGNGTITLNGSGDAYFLNCWSNTIDSNTPIIDMGGLGQNLVVRNYSGGLTITNKSGVSDIASFDINSGDITLTNSVTAGTIICRGVGTLTDNSAGATVINLLLNQDGIVNAVWDEPIDNHLLIGSAGEKLNTTQVGIISILGLVGENIKWSNISYDANHNMTAATITLYEDNTLLTPVKQWSITATYNADNEVQSYQMVEV